MVSAIINTLLKGDENTQKNAIKSNWGRQESQRERVMCELSFDRWVGILQVDKVWSERQRGQHKHRLGAPRSLAKSEKDKRFSESCIRGTGKGVQGKWLDIRRGLDMGSKIDLIASLVCECLRFLSLNGLLGLR